MAWWHYDDGEPAPAFRGRFDWSHAMPLLVIVAAAVLAWLLRY